MEKSMDWLLKGGLYIVSYNKIYGYANIRRLDVDTYCYRYLLYNKIQKVKVPWIILVYFMVVNSIVLIINRIIEEYQSNTHLEKISSNVALISSGIFIASIFVVGIITKIKEKR